MARTTGPLMSMDASGSIGGTLTYSKWKGRSYVRQLVIPSNPQTALQTSFRAFFKFLSQAWATIDPTDQDTWNGIADNNKVSDFNAYQQKNQSAWKNFLAPSQADPATRSGTPMTITSQSATGGVGLITIKQDPNSLNDNWGTFIHRSQTVAFTPTIETLIAVINVATSVEWTYTDSPLAAGTYKYRLIPFTLDGLTGTAGAELSAVAT